MPSLHFTKSALVKKGRRRKVCVSVLSSKSDDSTTHLVGDATAATRVTTATPNNEPQGFMKCMIGLAYRCGNVPGDGLSGRVLTAMCKNIKDKGKQKAQSVNDPEAFWVAYSDVERLSRTMRTELWQSRAVESLLELLRTLAEDTTNLSVLCGTYDALHALEIRLGPSQAIDALKFRVLDLASQSSTSPTETIAEKLIEGLDMVRYLCHKIAHGPADYGFQKALSRFVRTKAGQKELDNLDQESDLPLQVLERLLAFDNHFSRTMAFRIFGRWAIILRKKFERPRYYDLLIGERCLGALAVPWETGTFPEPLSPTNSMGSKEPPSPTTSDSSKGSTNTKSSKGSKRRPSQAFYREMEVAGEALLTACHVGFTMEVCSSEVPRLLVSQVELLVLRDSRKAKSNADQLEDVDVERNASVLFILLSTILAHPAGRAQLHESGLQEPLKAYARHKNRQSMQQQTLTALVRCSKLLITSNQETYLHP